MISAYKEMYAKLPTQFQLESYEESCLGDYTNALVRAWPQFLGLRGGE